MAQINSKPTATRKIESYDQIARKSHATHRITTGPTRRALRRELREIAAEVRGVAA